jgi:uncharacterized protein (TIGR02246 family)
LITLQKKIQILAGILFNIIVRAGSIRKERRIEMNAVSNELSPVLRHVRNATTTPIIIAISLIAASFAGIAEAQTIGDSASIYEFVKEYQQTFNTRDAVALSAFFTEDADVVVGNLLEAKGRQAIENLWRNYWQSKFNRQEPERKGTFTVNSLRKITDDVAMVNLQSVTGGRATSGTELRRRKARGTWVVHRLNGEWLIASVFMMPAETDSVVLGASVETAESLRPHIRKFVKAYEEAYDSHDPYMVTSFFRNDADIIVRNKPLVHGKQAIQEWWSSYFSIPRNFKVIMIIDEIRMITNDVVQVNLTVTGAIPGTENKLQPLRQISANWILVHDIDGWRIAALRVMPGKEDRVIRR